MYKKGIELSSSATSAYFNLGNLLISKGKIEEGFAYISKGVKLDPEFLDKQKLFSANIFGDSLNNPEVFFLYAKLYASLGNLEKTVEYLEKAKKAGFFKWERIEKEDAFKEFWDHPQLKIFVAKK
jgi:tetratricopeptide (TPR) repeat protein